MTGRHFGERYNKHLRTTSPIFDHSETTGHIVKLGNFYIKGRESQGITRAIKEGMYIRVYDPH